MAIRFLLGNMFKIGTLQGERIAAPVCALARNDREIGAWFLKLMTLPPWGKVLGCERKRSFSCVKPISILWNIHVNGRFTCPDGPDSRGGKADCL